MAAATARVVVLMTPEEKAELRGQGGAVRPYLRG